MMGSLDVVQLPFALGCYQVRMFLTIKVLLSEGRRKYPRPRLPWASFARWTCGSPHCVSSRLSPSLNCEFLQGNHVPFNHNCPSALHLCLSPRELSFLLGTKVTHDITEGRSPAFYTATSLSHVSFQVHLQNHLCRRWLNAG